MNITQVVRTAVIHSLKKHCPGPLGNIPPQKIILVLQREIKPNTLIEKKNCTRINH